MVRLGLLAAFLTAGCPPADTGSTPGDTAGDTARPAPVDADGDGVLSDADCDDANPYVYPGAEEWCDPVDHDCDGEPLAEGVCAKAQLLEAIASGWIDGDSWADVGKIVGFAGDLDGRPGEEAIFETWYPPAFDPGWFHQGFGILSAPLPPPGTPADKASDHYIVNNYYDDFFQTFPMGAGDFNGDGIGDVFMVSRDSDVSYGRAYLLLGPTTGWPHEALAGDVAAFAWEQEQYGDGFGYSIDAGGDFNGDGLADLAVTAPYSGYSDDPGIMLLAGRRDLPDGPGWLPLEDETRMEESGTEDIWFLGDQDGDGCDDIWHAQGWVSGCDIPVGETTEWAGITIGYSTHLTDPYCPSKYAMNLIPRFDDWNGDGHADILAICDDDGRGPGSWVLHLVDGAFLPDGKTGESIYDGDIGSWDLVTPDGSARPVVAGDLDGDGLADLVAAAYGYDDYGDETPSIGYVVLSSDGLPGPYTSLERGGFNYRSELDAPDATVFRPLGAGDLDGDGYDDLAMLAVDRVYTRILILSGWDLPWHDPQYW